MTTNARLTREESDTTVIMTATEAATTEPKPSSQRSNGTSQQSLPFRSAGTLFTPSASLSLVHGLPLASRTATRLWPWTPKIALLRRGLWPGPRVGVERRSRFGIWRLRQWFDSPAPLRIEADLRPGRRAILKSPVYRALVASRQ